MRNTPDLEFGLPERARFGPRGRPDSWAEVAVSLCARPNCWLETRPAIELRGGSSIGQSTGLSRQKLRVRVPSAPPFTLVKSAIYESSGFAEGGSWASSRLDRAHHGHRVGLRTDRVVRLVEFASAVYAALIAIRVRKVLVDLKQHRKQAGVAE